MFCFAILVIAAPAAANEAERCLRETGEAAVAACTHAINSSAGRPSINYTRRGIAHRDKGDTKRAIADHSEAIRQDPRYADAYYNRGNAYSDRGETDRAIADYTAAIRLDPAHANAHYNRGNAYSNKGDTDRAIADYTETIRLEPTYANAYYNRGNGYSKKGDTNRAIVDYTETIRLDPRYTNAYFNRGNGYGDKGDTARAIADYTEVIRLDPDYANAYINRGLAYEKLGDFASARSDFKATLGLTQKASRWAQDKARERLAVLPSSQPAAPSIEKTNVTTAIVTATAPISNNDRRIALVIGNSAYKNVAALPNPVNDASLVADVLKRTGFETVISLTNLRKDDLVSALRDFAARAETADWAVVYYAGHGMEVGGINYLIPTDARITADRDIGFEAVALEQVLNAAERARKLRLVILDACRDNPFANQMKRTLTVASRSVSRGLAAVEPEAGTLVVYAAKDGETALDGDGTNSPFTSAFVRNLPTPGVEVRRLFDFVRDDVMEATGRRQKPFSYGSISGRQDFYFVAGK
ncbi:tetratricopeptide repeat protein [Bradyrhizobium sp.]|uniref:tetratricopeptide repeat protein n=1 Tax=Bradyrhizobium sp. TaxID=376 RepID=UPI002D1FB9DC|nr:tetratricopeptide repeat protein [Bradyrhizobium sp.]